MQRGITYTSTGESPLAQGDGLGPYGECVLRYSWDAWQDDDATDSEMELSAGLPVSRDRLEPVRDKNLRFEGFRLALQPLDIHSVEFYSFFFGWYSTT